MSIVWGLNAVGLLFITVGGIGTALSAPSPKYNHDGSVSLSGEPDRDKRIAIHRRQRRAPFLLAAVGVGAGLQFLALLIHGAA